MIIETCSDQDVSNGGKIKLNRSSCIWLIPKRATVLGGHLFSFFSQVVSDRQISLAVVFHGQCYAQCLQCVCTIA